MTASSRDAGLRAWAVCGAGPTRRRGWGEGLRRGTCACEGGGRPAPTASGPGAVARCEVRWCVCYSVQPAYRDLGAAGVKRMSRRGQGQQQHAERGGGGEGALRRHWRAVEPTGSRLPPCRGRAAGSDMVRPVYRAVHPPGRLHSPAGLHMLLAHAHARPPPPKAPGGGACAVTVAPAWWSVRASRPRVVEPHPMQLLTGPARVSAPAALHPTTQAIRPH